MTLTTETETTKNALLSQLATFVSNGIESWMQAGEIVVQLLDSYGMTIQTIAERMTPIPTAAVSKLERLGRKQLVPSLLIESFAAAPYLSKLPYSEQKRLLEDDPVPVLLISDGAPPETLNVSVRNLTQQQCKQVFEGAAIRSEGAQRAWLESERERRAVGPKAHVAPYVIKRGRVSFTDTTAWFEPKDIVRILSELER